MNNPSSSHDREIVILPWCLGLHDFSRRFILITLDDGILSSLLIDGTFQRNTWIGRSLAGPPYGVDPAILTDRVSRNTSATHMPGFLPDVCSSPPPPPISEPDSHHRDGKKTANKALVSPRKITDGKKGELEPGPLVIGSKRRHTTSRGHRNL